MSTAVIGPAFAAVDRRHAASPVGRTDLRLTRRGRLVMTGLFLALALVLLVVFGSTSAATGEAGDQVATRTVMVAPGDTLWGIAADVAAPGEVREMVHRIQELNALPDASLAAGQRIAVPVGR